MGNKDVAGQKKKEPTELEIARTNVVRLLQERPSPNFFVRVGIRIRNFFRNLPYFSFTVFKSPLELALEQLAHAERMLNQAKAEKKENSSFLKNILSSTKQAVKQTFQPSQETSDILASTLIAYIDENMHSSPADLCTELHTYINLMKLHDQEPKEERETDAAAITWGKIRAAIERGGIINMLELEYILFKVKLLYPQTKDFDAILDIKNQQDFSSSSFGMIKSLGGSSTNKQSNTAISEQRSGLTLWFKNIIDQKTLRLQISAIVKQISDLNDENFTHKPTLTQKLNTLFNLFQQEKPNQTTIDRLDKDITTLLSTTNTRTATGSSSNKSRKKASTTEELKEKIKSIMSQIYALKPECDPTAGSSPSYQKA